MVSLIVVACEILLLALFLWYVFIHESHPYEITGDPWGLYDSSTKSANRHVQQVTKNRAFFEPKSDRSNGWIISDL
jgi:hypothetical protein